MHGTGLHVLQDKGQQGLIFVGIAPPEQKKHLVSLQPVGQHGQQRTGMAERADPHGQECSPLDDRRLGICSFGAGV
jgi:hypothetical protein